MLRLSIIAAAVFVSLPAMALDIPPQAAEILRCGVAFHAHSDALKEQGDTGGSTEFLYRGDELLQRGEFMLADAGFDAAATENIVMNTTLTASFEYPFDPEGMIAGCIAVVDDSP